MSTRHAAADGAAPPTDAAKTDAADTEAVAPEGTAQAVAVAAPETLVVAEPPPTPDYPRYRVEPGTNLGLGGVDPEESERYRGKRDVKDELDTQRSRIRDLQARLYAERKQSLLIVLQAMDTGGKDGTIRGVFEGVNPQGCQVWSFKAPSTE